MHKAVSLDEFLEEYALETSQRQVSQLMNQSE